MMKAESWLSHCTMQGHTHTLYQLLLISLCPQQIYNSNNNNKSQGMFQTLCMLCVYVMHRSQTRPMVVPSTGLKGKLCSSSSGSLAWPLITVKPNKGPIQAQ